jgi:4'-phosphopantetheinyl transferase
LSLAKLENIHENACWALWHITESAEQLENMLPEKLKKALVAEKITHTGRKQEWIAGRLALLELLRAMEEPFTNLEKDAFGKPQLTGSALQVNLTHSFPYAAAIVHRQQPTGIDMEQVQEKLGRLCPKFLSEQELAHANLDLHKLCLYWAAKETLYKLYGKRKLIFKKNILIDRFELQQKGYIKGNLLTEDIEKQYTLYYEQLDNFYICFNV